LARAVVEVCESASETTTALGVTAVPPPVIAAAAATPLLSVTTMAEASALWCFIIWSDLHSVRGQRTADHALAKESEPTGPTLMAPTSHCLLRVN
jgi:hypothetical protein